MGLIGLAYGLYKRHKEGEKIDKLKALLEKWDRRKDKSITMDIIVKHDKYVELIAFHHDTWDESSCEKLFFKLFGYISYSRSKQFLDEHKTDMILIKIICSKERPPKDVLELAEKLADSFNNIKKIEFEIHVK